MNLTNKKGVDISSNNGDISMETIKNAGYDFVMIRCGFGENISEQDDTLWEENVRKCEAAGLPWGAYFYSYACTEASAKSELEHALTLLKGKRPSLPVAFDMEDADGYKSRHGGWNRANVTRACRIFLEGMVKAGYYPMLYTGFEEIENYIEKAIWQKYDMWFAHWARSCGYKEGNLSIWQYGGETNLIDGNSIPGVGIIDKNLCYKDYPALIKNGGFNGWKSDKKTSTGLTAAQAMSGARALVGKDECPGECDIAKWYGGSDTGINEVACCCMGMLYLFYKLNALDLIPGGKVADCGSLAYNFYKAGQLHKPDEVKPGDLVIFSWSGKPTSVKPLDSLGYKCFEHVELCLKVFDDTIMSVGANNGGLECDDFQIKTRRRSDISACCRPKYADSGAEATPTVTEAVYGDKNVYSIQRWLNEKYSLDIYIDGIYGSQTKAALVKALQKELNRQYGAGLAVDGIYGPMTNSAVRNLSKGDTGALVSILQGLLICNGYPTGGHDGIFGYMTEASVLTYQEKEGLEVDGIAGKQTFEALCNSW